MDFSKMKGAGGRNEANNSAELPDKVSDGKGRGPTGQMGPKNITETKAFQQGMGGIRSLWGNYLNILASNFNRMTRAEQEMFILRMSQVVTIGFAMVLASFFYQFIPLLVRVFAFPVFLIGSWFVATRIVSPIIIAQVEHKLNRP